MKKLLLTLIVSLAMCGSIFAQQYESHWPDFRYTAFLSQNPIVAAIAIDGEIVTTENHPDNWNALEVAFFVGDECRGAGAAFGSYSPEVNYLDDSFVGEGGDPYPTIGGAPIYFNTVTGEEVTVKMFDHVNGIEYNECTVTLSGESYVIVTGVDNTQGWDDPENPIILNFTTVNTANCAAEAVLTPCTVNVAHTNGTDYTSGNVGRVTPRIVVIVVDRAGVCA